jgi:signal transduction histidine kinase
VNCPPFPADPKLLKQVFVNPLGNAVKFIPTGRKPYVTVESGPDPAGTTEPVITVRDNGIGFDPAHAERVLAVFQRLGNSADYEGTGIGLSIVQRIISRHGGRVWASGNPGQGATFSFTLGPDTRIQS